jgi:hypothetical protein
MAFATLANSDHFKLDRAESPGFISDSAGTQAFSIKMSENKWMHGVSVKSHTPP